MTVVARLVSGHYVLFTIFVTMCAHVCCQCVLQGAADAGCSCGRATAGYLQWPAFGLVPQGHLVPLICYDC